MSRLMPGSFAGTDVAISSFTDQRSVRLVYAAFAAAGTRSVLCASQAGAVNRQYLMVGDGSIDMTSAIAQAICKNPDDTPITASSETQRANLATGMVTYFTNIPAAADAANCIAFAIGGLSCSTLYQAVLRNYKRASTAAANPSNNLININAATVIGGPATVQPGNEVQIALNGSSAILLQDGSTALTYGTNSMVICPAYGVIFGSFAITDVLDVPAANDILELEVYFG